MAETLTTEESLREVAEALLSTQKAMGEDVAEMAAAVTELAQTGEQLVKALGSIDELRRSVEQLGEMMHAYTSKMGELHDQQVETAAQLGRYLQDAAKQQSGIRDVDRRLRLLEGGAGHGER